MTELIKDFYTKSTMLGNGMEIFKKRRKLKTTKILE